MSKPEGYPLPWCEALDLPYWKVNLFLCRGSEWYSRQSGKPMSEIIPWIDEELAKGEILSC